MFTPKELLYVNTFLEKEERGIWVRYCQGYEVGIKRKSKYTLQFEDAKKAIEFERRLDVGGKDGMSLNNGVIVINKNDDDYTVLIKCGQNEELATKLVKYLRKQWVKNRKQELKQIANQDKITQEAMKQEIEDTGLKF